MRSGIDSYQHVRWLDATLINSWINANTALNPNASYTRDQDGRVWLRGVVSSGASGTVAFVLPPDFRPRARQHLAAYCDNGVTGFPGAIIIDTNGNVTLAGGGTSLFVLSGAFDTRA